MWYFFSAYLLTNKFDNSIKNRYTIGVSHYGVSKPSYSGVYGIWQTGYGKVDGVNGDCNMVISNFNFEEIIKNKKW